MTQLDDPRDWQTEPTPSNPWTLAVIVFGVWGLCIVGAVLASAVLLVRWLIA